MFMGRFLMFNCFPGSYNFYFHNQSTMNTTDLIPTAPDVDHQEDDTYFMSMEREDVMKMLYMVISMFGIPGNIVTLIAILTSPKMRAKPFNILIVHQSWIDLFACVCAFLVQIVEPGYTGIIGHMVCQIWSSMYLLWVFFVASSYNLTAIAIERYLAITRPLQYDEESVLRRMPFVFVVVWLIGFVFDLPEALLSKAVSGECVLYYNLSYTYQVVLNIFYSLLSPVVPLIIMAYCYAVIAITLRASSKLHTKAAASSGAADMRRAEIRIIQSTVILSAFFLASYLYMYVIQYGYTFFELGLYPHYHVSIAFIIMNSCINPYVYCIRYDEFQNRVREMFCRFC